MPMIQTPDHPTILVVAKRSRDCWLLQFRCDWCDKIHTHGGGNDLEPGRAGARASHCLSPNALAGYSLKIARFER
jgi:hypothetical protein